MIAQLIQEMLGPNWWEREHDGTAICVMLDRIMEEFGVDLEMACCEFRLVVFWESNKNNKLYNKWRKRLSKLTKNIENL